MRPIRPSVAAAAILLLSLHAFMALASKHRKGMTADEIVHVTGGYSYWKFGDYRLHPENGNLAQRWVALPSFLGGAKFPPLDQLYWRISDGWVMGHEFFFETGDDPDAKLSGARAMTVVLSVALGALVFLWSRELFGSAGGLLSLAFYAFSPTMLAHGGLATSDTCAALFFLAAMGAYWRHLARPGAGPMLLSAVVFGLACVAKFSAPLLVPMMAACALVHILFSGGSPARVLLSAAGHAAAAFAVIWAFYGFRYSAFNPALPPADHFIEPWAEMYARTGAVGRLIHGLADMRALPEAFLYGAAYVAETTQSRGAFLNGQVSTRGWPTFFLWAFALKTTIPFMGAAAAGTWVAVRGAAAGAGRGLRALVPLTPLLALVAIYSISSLSLHLNIGQRHLLPIYPPLFILAGALGKWLAKAGSACFIAAAALLAWHVTESGSVAPNYLAYFNELAGGPSGGYRHLVDSSLDWGQDLPSLKEWLAGHRAPGEDAYLAYFGSDEPARYKLGAKQLTFINLFHEPDPYIDLGPGIYCVGATVLQQVYSPVTGPWSIALERQYETLRAFAGDFRAYCYDPAARARLEQRMPAARWEASIDRYEHLRLARLCAYLVVRRPDANVGHSILIYRLDAGEIRAATAGSLSEWTALIERSGVGASSR
ncbi:MAG TPA: glycosyltransferase family 39 protein [Opitutaceae bacterium]|jgi:hypothetical protein